ncbi:hypothetical protein [Legionella septentrionalis]|uniref:Uncharacterized protein n=1 Tax=Legionella septentrionalis TaxID=2498109 RepID=A0A3S0VAI6_9GAMM|nr:hypothetical protein [Legionella septentrionalis]RUQ85347.1 hypothetical protein EKM59_06820 [Legionella septentrionalis]
MPFNPFIHGTSSQTLSMMQHTDFQLMPIVAMLNNFKVAPMVGELTQGGFSIIGHGSNLDTITGAPAFGRIEHTHYDLDKVVGNYAKNPNDTNLQVCQEYFKNFLKSTHKSAFSDLNLLMIYLVRLRQFGVNITDVVSADEINTLRERLHATVQFYYFLMCVQKHIYIHGAAIDEFKKENDLQGDYAAGDYIEHFFSFEAFLEKLKKTQFNMEEIYNSPSFENINKLLDFIKIPKGYQEKIKRNPCGEDNFAAKRDYHFFSSQKPESGEVFYEEIGGYLFTNHPSYSFAYYLERYYQSYMRAQSKAEVLLNVFPDFENFHSKVLSHIEALQNRITLCKALLDARDEEFIRYDEQDELIAKPFPVVFVTEAKTIEEFENEYRSRVPLKLGKEMQLLATDNKENQKRLRDYLQKNHVGPAEVLLFDDLYALRSKPEHYFDALGNDVWGMAFELAKKQNCMNGFCKLYRTFAELNEKRYRFKTTNKEVYGKLNELFIALQQTILTPDKNKIDFKGIQNTLQRHRQENYILYATHRGILGYIDTLLTILASLVIFYPITYVVQKSMNIAHTFFATDTEKKINNSILAVDEILDETAVLG